MNSVPTQKADEKVGAIIQSLEGTRFEEHALRWRVDSGENTLWHEFPRPREPNIEAISTQAGGELVDVIKPYKVESNSFALQCKASHVQQMHVSIKRELRPAREGEDEAQPTAEFLAIAEDPPKTAEEAFEIMVALAERLGWTEGKWAYDGRSTLFSMDDAVRAGESTGGDKKLLLEEVVDLGGKGKGRRSTPWKVSIQLTTTIDMRCMSEMATFCEEAIRSKVVEPYGDAVRVLEVVWRHAAMLAPGMSMLSRSIFNCLSQDPGLKEPLRPKDQRASLSPEVLKEVRIGASVHIYASNRGPVLVANSSPALMLKQGNLADILKSVGLNLHQTYGPGDPVVRTLQQAIKGRDLVVQPGNKKERPVRPRGLHEESAASYAFEARGEQVSVQQYWENIRGEKLRYPNFNLVDVSRSKQRAQTQPELIPAELLAIKPGQLFSTGTQYADQLIRLMAKRPNEKKKQIQAVMKELTSPEMMKHVQEWMELPQKKQLTSGNAFLLASPILQYGAPHNDDGTVPEDSAKAFEVREGTWNAGTTQLLKREALQGFAILDVARRDRREACQLVDRFVAKLRDVGAVELDGRSTNSSDVHVQAKDLGSHEDGVRLVQQALNTAKNNGMRVNDAFVLFVPIDSNSHNYKFIKSACEDPNAVAQYGFPDLKRVISQCFDPFKAAKGRDMYALNIAFKINMKLGGVNFSLWGMPRGLPRMSDILRQAAEKPSATTGAFMFIGVDVSHPERSAGNLDSDAFSVACITASMDPYLGQYASVPIVQQVKGQEAVLDQVKPAMSMLLEAYKKRNGHLPQQFVVFRDGVAEGQYNEILQTEINQMKDAIREEFETFYMGREEELLEAPPLPTAVGQRANAVDDDQAHLLPRHCAMSVVVCRKRIQTRLLPGEGPGKQLQNGNVLPGTVASDGVLSALRQNFLLVSAAGIQGTSKPTEYVCILDEIGFSPESLAMLSFWSCHTYGLCTRAVGVPAPIFYAHKSCTRVRVLLTAMEPGQREEYIEAMKQIGTSTYVQPKSMLF